MYLLANLLWLIEKLLDSVAELGVRDLLLVVDDGEKLRHNLVLQNVRGDGSSSAHGFLQNRVVRRGESLSRARPYQLLLVLWAQSSAQCRADVDALHGSISKLRLPCSDKCALGLFLEKGAHSGFLGSVCKNKMQHNI